MAVPKPFKPFVSTLRGAAWLLRGAGLRGEVRQLQEQLAHTSAQLAQASARLAETATHLSDLRQQVLATSCKTDFLTHHVLSKAHVRGHQMFLDPTDGEVSRCLFEQGGMEGFETELVESEVRPGDVVLDVGANIGYYTLLFARLVGPEGRVIAFEPDPLNFLLLKRNVRANGYRNVELVNKAVADTTGTMRLYLSRDNKGDHRLYDSRDGREAVDIAVTTLDDALAGYDGRLDFIKMDIQGSEARALAGMTRLLAKYRRLKMVTEFWPIGLQRAGADAAAYLRRLLDHGFRLQQIDDEAEELRPADVDHLLTTYLPEKENYTNLFCVRE